MCVLKSQKNSRPLETRRLKRKNSNKLTGCTPKQWLRTLASTHFTQIDLSLNSTLRSTRLLCKTLRNALNWILTGSKGINVKLQLWQSLEILLKHINAMGKLRNLIRKTNHSEKKLTLSLKDFSRKFSSCWQKHLRVILIKTKLLKNRYSNTVKRIKSLKKSWVISKLTITKALNLSKSSWTSTIRFKRTKQLSKLFKRKSLK